MIRSVTRILVVDDHAVVRSGVRRHIEEEPGLEVCGEAANGYEAVELTASTRPDLILLDISMPGLNGLDTLRAMMKIRPRAEVVIFSMHDSETLIKEMIMSGARGYVLKTDPPEILIRAIRALSVRRPFFSPSVAGSILETYIRLVKEDARPGPITGDILTPRERQILQKLAEGASNKELAAALSISVKTVETHRAAIMRKVGARSIVDVVRYAIRNNLTQA